MLKKQVSALIVLGFGIVLAATVSFRMGLFAGHDRASLLIFIEQMRTSQHAPLLFVSIYTVAAALGVPVTALTLAGGVLFGPVLGMVLNWTSDLAAAALAFAAGRFVAGRRKRSELNREDRGFMGLLRLRVIPVVPFAVLNFGSAMYGMTWPAFLAATAIGVVPATVVYTMFAAQLVAGVKGAGTRAFIMAAVSAVMIIALSLVPPILRKRGRKVGGLGPPLLSVLAAILFAASPRTADAQSMNSAQAENIHDLPITELVSSGKQMRNAIVLFITGDGGWADIDKVVTRRLVERGFDVVGVDSRAYLGTKRTPERVAEDMGRIIRHYTTLWNKESVALVGYSRGADLAPFIVNRLDSSLRLRIKLVAMLGLGPRAGFEFHFVDIFRDVKRAEDLATLPELEKVRGPALLCVYGSQEKESACRDAPDSVLTRIERPGGHHFDDNYNFLADLIVDKYIAAGQR